MSDWIVRDLPPTPTRRRRPRVIRSLAALAVLGAIATGCSNGTSDEGQSVASAEVETSLLFSVIAPSLTVMAEGDGHRISRPSTSPVSWFTDRPERSAGSLDAAALASLWAAEDFYDDPPNAALVVTVSGEQQQFVVELTDARVDGDIVSFQATPIGDDEEAQAGGRSATHGVAVGSFGASELFIDNASTPPCASSITAYSRTKCLLAPNQTVYFSMKPPYAGGCIDTLQSARGQTTAVTYLISPGYQAVPSWIDDSSPTFCLDYPSGASWAVQNGANPSLFGYDYPQEF